MAELTKIVRIGWIVIVVVFGISGCVYHHPEEPAPSNQPEIRDCSEIEVSFKDEVKAIIEMRCAKSGCHNSSASRVDLSVYENILTYRNQMISRVESGSMPYDEPLPQNLKHKLLCWLDAGALNN